MQKRAKTSRIKIKCLIFLGVIFLFSMIFFGAIVSAKNDKDAAPLYKYYTSIQINKGDTLWKIAGEYCHDSDQMNAYVKELKQINHLNSDEIHAGYYLTVIYYSDQYK